MIEPGLAEARATLSKENYGRHVGKVIMEAVLAKELAKPRTVQSKNRVLGMSDLGGCREFIRATVAGEPKATTTRVKWAADIGTAVGDFVEDAVTTHVKDAKSQDRITVTLPKSGIEVSGSTDLQLDRSTLVDLKTKAELGTVESEGPSLENVVQVSGYLIGGIQSDKYDPDAVAVLVYLDRSGTEAVPWTYTITADEARVWLDEADERLKDVAKALTAKLSPALHLRDKPESWCFHVQCPFYNACWEGYEPTGELTEFEEEQVALYDKGRQLKKQGEQIIATAKSELYTDPEHNVQGNGKQFRIKWTPFSTASGEVRDKIDVREIR